MIMCIKIYLILGFLAIVCIAGIVVGCILSFDKHLKDIDEDQ